MICVCVCVCYEFEDITTQEIQWELHLHVQWQPIILKTMAQQRVINAKDDYLFEVGKSTRVIPILERCEQFLQTLSDNRLTICRKLIMFVQWFHKLYLIMCDGFNGCSIFEDKHGVSHKKSKQSNGKACAQQPYYSHKKFSHKLVPSKLHHMSCSVFIEYIARRTLTPVW